jgi:hypothetical protein
LQHDRQNERQQYLQALNNTDFLRTGLRIIPVELYNKFVAKCYQLNPSEAYLSAVTIERQVDEDHDSWIAFAMLLVDSELLGQVFEIPLQHSRFRVGLVVWFGFNIQNEEQALCAEASMHAERTHLVVNVTGTHHARYSTGPKIYDFTDIGKLKIAEGTLLAYPLDFAEVGHTFFAQTTRTAPVQVINGLSYQTSDL